MNKIRVVAVAAIVAAVPLVAGGVAYANRGPQAQVASPTWSGPTPASSVTLSLPPPSVSPSPSPTTKPTPAKTATKKAKVAIKAACGAGLSKIWANWPIPRGSDYTNLGDGTVRDNVTCLEWQRTPATESYTFEAAKSYCDGLDLDGGGWHLPSRIELTSIVNTARSGPAIDTSAFPGTPVAFFWTSSPWAVTKEPLRAWIINFYEGLASNGAYQSGAYRVRCVRSGTGSGRPGYQVSDGTVTDPATGLVWQRAASASITPEAADSYCAGLTLGDRSWRLPTLRELSSTVDETRVAPAIDVGAFPDTAKNDWYWTSDDAAPEAGKRWALNYNDGFTNYRKATAGFARCVSG